MHKAINIRVEFEDGSILSAEGPDANSIWQWLQQAQTFAFIHGQEYHGAALTKSQKETK